MSELDELFDAVRGACSAGTWSKAVELVRRLSVSSDGALDGEILCRVNVPNRVVPHTVQLYPDDAEWACDCTSRAPCCEHVAAAVIAVRKARAEGRELSRGKSHGGRLMHRFSRHRGELSLERVLVLGDGKEKPLTTTLASAVATNRAGLGVSPSQQDLNVDRVLSLRIRGILSTEQCTSVLKLLASSRNVELDGVPVHVGTEVIKPIARVSDDPEGYRVTIAADPRITEIVASGVVLLGSSLHLLADTRSTGPKLERLPDEKVYPKRDVGVLVTEVLPELSKRCALEVQTRALPKLTREAKPRIVLDVEQQGTQLSALLTLVYGAEGKPPLARIDNGQLVHLRGDVPLRNESQEQHLLARARETLGLTPGSRVFVEGEAAARLAERLDAWGGEVSGSQGKRFIRSGALVPRVEQQDGVLRVNFRGASSSDTEDSNSEAGASAEAVLDAWLQGHQLVPLLSGGFAPLPTEWLEAHGELLEQVLAARGNDPKTKIPSHAAPAWVRLCEALNHPPPRELEPFRALLRGIDQLPHAELPKDLRAELRGYQRRGVDWLGFLRDARLGAVLADDMGLGKTLQAACILRGRCLVVSPTSVVHNWADELRKFRPELSFSIYHGKQRQFDPDVEVTLTSYALLRLDLDRLSAQHWDIVVLDEAQTIKNPESQVAQAAYALSADFRLTLSGTPVENRLDELWSQFHFVQPGLLGGRADFQRRFAEPIRSANAEAAARLRQRIAPFLLRRDKAQVAPELPPRTDIVLHCDLGERERTLYDALHAATQKDVVEKLRQGGSVMQALEALLRLRQASCHPGLIPGQTAESSAKLDRLLEALEEARAEGHKALVFSQWTSLLDLLEPKLIEAGIRFSRLDGTTRDRPGVVAEFQTDGGPEVLLLSLKAGGTGLNLTQADHVFLLDPWWNPAVEQQAADRAHRIGQTRPVFVHRLIARRTVEERISLLQQKKRELASVALEDAAAAASLTRDDLLALLD